MKFGKRFLKAQRPDFNYLDYKALKQLLKLLFDPGSHNSDLAAVEADFEAELLHGVEAVNAFFVAKERELLAALPLHEDAHDAEQQVAADAYFREVCELYGYVIMNYLAVLKIVKKHDKHVSALARQQQRLRSVSAHQQLPQPLRGAVLDVLFSQAFYLSLEHSFLFDACKQHLKDLFDAAHGRNGTGEGEKEEEEKGRSRASWRDGIGSSCGGGVSGGGVSGGGVSGGGSGGGGSDGGSSGGVSGGTTAVLMGATPLGPGIDFSVLRACHREGPVDAATTRMIEMQIECLLVIAGGPTFRADRGDGVGFAPPTMQQGRGGGGGVNAGSLDLSSSAGNGRMLGSSRPLPCHSPVPVKAEGMEEAGSNWAESTAALWGVSSLDAGTSRSWAGRSSPYEGGPTGAAGRASRSSTPGPLPPARRTLGFHKPVPTLPGACHGSTSAPAPSAVTVKEPIPARALPDSPSTRPAVLPKQPRTREEGRRSAGEGGEEEATAQVGRTLSPQRSQSTLSVHEESPEEDEGDEDHKEAGVATQQRAGHDDEGVGLTPAVTSGAVSSAVAAGVGATAGPATVAAVSSAAVQVVTAPAEPRFAPSMTTTAMTLDSDEELFQIE